jgi:hypothetical protein
LKSLDKNITSHDKITSFMVVQSMQGRMASAALTNGLSLSTTVGLDDKGIPYLGYAVKYHGEDRAVFHGQARLPNDPHYAFVMQMLVGAVVSEVCPPAMRKTPGGEIVSYWKRNLTIEHDITVMEHADTEAKTDPLDKVRRITSWIGYNPKGVEVIRVQEGTANEGYQEIERVQFLSMGGRGNVAAVIFKGDNIPTSFETTTLGDSIKDTERQRQLADQECASTAGVTLASASSTSFSERFADTGLSSVSPSRMSLSAIDKVRDEILAITSIGKETEEVMYGGMRVVMPKILNEEEFTALDGDAKNQYLGHIDGIIKLTMNKNFEIAQTDAKLYEKFIAFLKHVLESGVFKGVWEKNYIAKATQYHELRTLPYYTARSLGMFDIMIARIIPEMRMYLSLDELKEMRPDLKDLGPRGENVPAESAAPAKKAPARKPAAKKAAAVKATTKAAVKKPAAKKAAPKK